MKIQTTNNLVKKVIDSYSSLGTLLQFICIVAIQYIFFDFFTNWFNGLDITDHSKPLDSKNDNTIEAQLHDLKKEIQINRWNLWVIATIVSLLGLVCFILWCNSNSGSSVDNEMIVKALADIVKKLQTLEQNDMKLRTAIGKILNIIDAIRKK
jgi:H+/Cl- antiporter ClcA